MNKSIESKNYKKCLAQMIFEFSNGDIPEKICVKLANKGMKYKKYISSNWQKELTMEELTEHLVWSYFSGS